MMPDSRKPGASLKSLKWLAIAAALVFVVPLILWLRVFYGSMQDYKTGETLLKENQTIRAITYFDRSLHWYAPLNPYMERSAKRLWEIGEKAEKEGDMRMARIAFESIRNACYGTSHVFTPGEEWIDKTESRIKKLEGEKAPKGDGLIEAGHPKKSPHPRVGWSVSAVVGFLGWIASIVGFIVFSFRKDRRGGSAVLKRVVWVCLILAFAALWVAGMVMA
jgi:hypothetical protein